MRYVSIVLTAACSALLIGSLVGGVAQSARAADLAKAAAQPTSPPPAADGSLLTEDRLAEAAAQLDAAYRELVSRDAAYRALLAQANDGAARLEAVNRALATQLAAAPQSGAPVVTRVAPTAPQPARVVRSSREREREDREERD